MLSDEIMALLLEEQEVPLDLIHKTIREGTIAQQICPVMVGTAYRNKGVQSLLDAVEPLSAQPARSRDLRQGQHQRRGRGAAGPRSRRAAGRHGVQAGRGAVRPGHLRPDLPGDARQGDLLLQHAAAEAGPDQPDPPRPRRPEGRHRLGLAPATSSPSWGSSAPPATRTAPRGATCRSRASTPPSRSSTCRSSRPSGPTTTSSPRPSTASCARTRPSACTSTTRPARRSSRGWASCTWRSTSSGSAASTRSSAPSARRRSATARRRPSRRRSTTSTRSRPAARASTPTSSAG